MSCIHIVENDLVGSDQDSHRSDVGILVPVQNDPGERALYG